MTNELVSVIIPTYKRPEYLLAAVRSVMAQTYEKIEIIVVDDNGEGTSDQLITAEVINNIDDKRLIYHVQKKNMGVCVARNTGISISKGKYVAFLDNDDLFLPQKIEKQVEFFSMSDESLAGCGTWYKRFYENGTEFECRPQNVNDVFASIIKLEELYATGSTALIKRSALDEIGYFDASYVQLEDPELIMRLALRYNFGVVEENLTLIRIHDNYTQDEARYSETWLLKLLDQYKAEIMKMSGSDIRIVYFNHYYTLSKEYLKERNFSKAFSYFVLCKAPVKYITNIIKDGWVYKKKLTKISR